METGTQWKQSSFNYTHKRGWCLCVCLGVATYVNSLLAHVCACVCAFQDKDIEGEEEEEEAVTAVSKVNSTTSQLFGRNSDTKTLFAPEPTLRFHTDGYPPEHMHFFYTETHIYHSTLMIDIIKKSPRPFI